MGMKSIICSALAGLFFCAPAIAVDVNGEEVPYATWHHMMLPGETLKLGLADGETATLDGEPVGGSWTAGESGNHKLVRFIIFS